MKLYEILCTEGISAQEIIVPVWARTLDEAAARLRAAGYVPNDPDVREFKIAR